MISFILIALAAILNASMDVCQFHYEKSFFVRFKKPMYFNGAISWKKKYIDWDKGDKRMKKWIFGLFNFPVAFIDWWHFAKSGMIILLVFAIVVYNPVFNLLLDFIAMGIIWNLFFNVFYNRILRKK
jgi:hypothetical protein